MIVKTACLIVLGLLAAINQVKAIEKEREEACVGWQPRSVDLNLPDILQGFTLEVPVVRYDVNAYVEERAGQQSKLVIGAGHIHELRGLHPDYQPGGTNSLTESLQGGYDFHKHEGWYTFSAETDYAFGSDMIGNIRTPSHQEAIFVPNSWDIIWDESYHPSVLSAPKLFENAFASLKPAGIFVFTVPIHHRSSDWIVAGHYDNKAIENPCFNEKIAYQNLSDRFRSLAEAEDFLRSNLQEIGFSTVNLYKSSIVIAADEMREKLQRVDTHETEEIDENFIVYKDALVATSTKLDQDWVDTESLAVIGEFERTGKNLDEVKYSIVKRVFSNAAPIAANLERNPLLAIDEIFAHTIGMYYFVARKE